jgi:hypothetical protein
VGHDVVQLAGDAYPLLPDTLAGAFGLGGSLPLGLFGLFGQFGQSGQVAPPGRDAGADEPGRGQGQQEGQRYQCRAHDKQGTG